MNITATELHNALQSGKNIALIDVRTPVEHAEMRIRDSQLMPLDQLNPSAVKTAAQQAEQCVLICLGGKRAEQARQKLQASGCENLTVLEGGVTAWQNQGLPLERSERKGLPLIRQVQLIIGLLAITGSGLALTVNKNFALLPLFLGCGLTLAGSTGWCGLAILLSKMPWNRIECAGKDCQSCSL